MIVSEEDIQSLERFLELFAAEDLLLEDHSYTPKYSSPAFFANNPHFVLPLGYDEYRAIRPQHDPTAFDRATMLGFRDSGELVMEFESFFRKESSGEWHWYEGLSHQDTPEQRPTKLDLSFTPGTIIEAWGIPRDPTPPDHLHFVGSQGSHRYVPITELVDRLKLVARQPDDRPRSLLLPNLWTPLVQLDQRLVLEEATKDLVREVASGHRELASIHWRELEELVAELLASRGMEIILTPRSRDGGRDVIARGELIPGEPTIIAVEVKQKKTVTLEDVQQALKANEDFPSLLVATAGLFSAGVIQEKLRERNQLRLFLKDGVALRQWIDVYFGQN